MMIIHDDYPLLPLEIIYHKYHPTMVPPSILGDIFTRRNRHQFLTGSFLSHREYPQLSSILVGFPLTKTIHFGYLHDELETPKWSRCLSPACGLAGRGLGRGHAGGGPSGGVRREPFGLAGILQGLGLGGALGKWAGD